MTKRAELAAAELMRRGWQIDDSFPLTTACQRCGYAIEADHYFCGKCGRQKNVAASETCLDDIEAAISKALGETS